MLVMLLPRRDAETSRQITGDAILGGVAMALCVYCKINYLLAAAFLCAWWLFYSAHRVRRASGVLAGFLLVTVILAVKPGELSLITFWINGAFFTSIAPNPT